MVTMIVNWLRMEVFRLLVRVPLAVGLLAGTCGGAPPVEETPADLFRRLPANRTYSPSDRALEDRIVALGNQALPVIEQELRLGIKFKELNTLLQTNGSRRAAAIAALVRIPGEKSTDLLVRSLADPPDSYD
jgi:hypothetical protein